MQLNIGRRAGAWQGDAFFLLQTLIEKDFKVRYRNMSLGVFWSLLNPLVMMGVLWLVFTKIFVNPTPHFAPFVLCGLVPFNFFTLAWLASTTSLVDNAGLVKRTTAPRAMIPVSVVLANCVHFGIQTVLLLVITVASGKFPTIYWLWIPFILLNEIALLCGLGLIFSALNVFVRDTRYFVESCNLILFWLVPIVYSFSIIPQNFREIYQLNPLAALVFAMRNVLLDGVAPANSLLVKLSLICLLSLAVGVISFRKLARDVYDYL